MLFLRAHRHFGRGRGERRPNMAELVFLDEHCRDLYVDCVAKERAVVGNLRLVSGQHPDDPALASLVGRLTMASPTLPRCGPIIECARAPAPLRVAPSARGTLTVTQQTLRSVDVPDQSLVTCTTERDSPSAEALILLAQIIRNAVGLRVARIGQTHGSQQDRPVSPTTPKVRSKRSSPGRDGACLPFFPTK